MDRTRANRRWTGAAACLFLSGGAGLIDQLTWMRQAALVFGSSTQAVGAVAGVFLLGLALGSEAAGRLSPRVGRPLRLFAALELALVAWTLATPWAFAAAERGLGPLESALEGQRALIAALRLLLVAAIVLPPAALMGGTLPLFCRSLLGGGGAVARPVSLLYGVNTAGAAVGALVAGWVLLPSLGIRGTLLTSAALGGAAALLALALERGAAAPSPTTTPTAEAGRVPPGRVLLFVFLAGFLALGHEVLWARFLALVLRSGLAAWSLTLAAVLGGVVLGSLGAAAAGDRSRARVTWLGLSQILAALGALALLHLPPAHWTGMGRGAVALLVLPAACAGASLPLAVRLVASDGRQAGSALGRLAAASTLGGLCGSLAMSFVGLPRFGMAASLHGLTGLGILAATLAWLGLQSPPRRLPPLLGLAAALALWPALPAALGTRLPHAHLVEPGETLVDCVEGLAGNLAVLRRGGVTSLEIDRWWQGEDRTNHQAAAAAVPLVLHGGAEDVLVVGAGTGQTPAAFLAAGVRQLTVVDVEPAVFDVIRRHFDGAWLDDPRVSLSEDDGRHHLLTSRREWDLVSLELGQLLLPGVAACYTTEAYERVRQQLRPGGVCSQFVPTAFLTPAMFRRVVATFRASFPQALLWFNTSELLLLGRRDGSFQLDGNDLGRRLADPALAELLAFAHWGGPEHELRHWPALLAGLLCGPAGLARLADGAALLTDDRLDLEWSAASVAADARLEEDLVRLLGPHLDDPAEVLGLVLGEAERAAVADLREGNLGDLLAEAHLRRAAGLAARDDHHGVLVVAERALTCNPRSVRALRLAGEALLGLGRPAEAADRLRQALHIRPADGPCLSALGFAEHRQGRPEEALRHYLAALEQGPASADLHNNLGAALAELGRWDEAAAHFRRALAVDPGWADARRNLELLERVVDEPLAPAEPPD